MDEPGNIYKVPHDVVTRDRLAKLEQAFCTLLEHTESFEMNSVAMGNFKAMEKHMTLHDYYVSVKEKE